MDIPSTFGAILIGNIVAATFTGVVVSQCFSYYKHYGQDPLFKKLLVLLVLVLDLAHTTFISMSIWDHLIAHFGSEDRIDSIPWSLALTIVATAILTFVVHLFFIHRIYLLSGNKIVLCLPLTIMASARLCFASLTTTKLIALRSLHTFAQLYAWSFTIGLSLSVLVDVLITGSLYFLLRRKRGTDAGMDYILDSIMLYAFENGSLTCIAAVASLVFWIFNRTTLIFMAIHFVISKLYASSLLATLNARKELQPIHNPTYRTLSVRGNRSTAFTIGTASTNSTVGGETISGATTVGRNSFIHGKLTFVDSETPRYTIEDTTQPGVERERSQSSRHVRRTTVTRKRRTTVSKTSDESLAVPQDPIWSTLEHSGTSLQLQGPAGPGPSAC